MRRLMACLLLLTLLPACALAVPDTPYAPETVLQTDELSDGASALLDALYPAIRRCEERIDLPAGARYDDVSAAMQCLSRNYPELFHLENTWLIGYYQDSPDIATQVKPSYSMPAKAYEASLTALLDVARDLASAAPSAQADCAEFLHDLLCLRVAYDAGEIGEANNTAAGALLLGQTQCEGYAQALALLYRLAGIPCGVVTGDSLNEDGLSRHAWNAAVIEGIPTLIDATWNDQDDNGRVTHWYYGLTSAMMAADHFPDPELTVPTCASTAVNWHARRGLLLSDQAGIMAALSQFSRDGEVSIRFADEALYADADQRMNDYFYDYNAACPPEETFYGLYGISVAPEQLCMLLWRIEEEPEA